MYLGLIRLTLTEHESLKAEQLLVQIQQQQLRNQIYELIYNLCDNAVKYNKDDGTVNVVIRQCVDGVELSVRDSGIGIPKDEIPRIFERFYRVDKSHSKEIGGTGLGLSIVKHGALYHNASISVDSALNEGTTIKILF